MMTDSNDKLSSAARIRVLEDAPNADESITIIIRLSAPLSEAQADILTSAGLSVSVTAIDIVGGEIAPSKLDDLANLEFVETIDVSQSLKPEVSPEQLNAHDRDVGGDEEGLED